MLVHHFLESSAIRFSDNEAVVFNGKRLTYEFVDLFSNQLANHLINTGFAKSNRVAFVLDNSINYIIATFGVMKAGGVAVGQNTLSGESYLRNVFADAGISVVITQNTFAEKVRNAIEDLDCIRQVILVDQSPAFSEQDILPVHYLDTILGTVGGDSPDVEMIDLDLAAIIYTSGSTGKPRGVALSHLNLVSNTKSIVEYLQIDSSDRVMAILPFSYSYGFSVLLTHFFVGGCVVINNRFAFPKVVLDQMIEEQCTGFSGVPTNFVLLLKKTNIKDRLFPDLKYVTQAGGAMPPSIAKELKQALPDHVRIFIMYGQTEASPRLSYFCLNEHEDKLGSIGQAVPNVELTIRRKDGRVASPGEIGEIVARGSNIMKQYWGQIDESSDVIQDDGLHTGDLAKADEDGFIFIVGRKSDMIKSGANRISSKEVEETLYLHDEIEEAAVIGVPDEIMGEAIVAYVALTKGSELTEREIILFCREKTASFKVPKSIVILPLLPKNSSGKIMKNDLADSYSTN